MSARRFRRWPAAFLTPVVIALAGCASVSSFQQAKVRYDRQDEQNREQIQQYNREIAAVIAAGRAYQSSLASEAQLRRENTALRQTIAELQSKTGPVPSGARPPVPSSGLEDLGRAIDADAYGRLRQELRDCAALQRFCERRLKAFSVVPVGSPGYRKEAEMTRAGALLSVIAEALVTADVAGRPAPAARASGDSRAGGDLAALAAAQDRLVAALHELELSGRDSPEAKFARARAAGRDLLTAIADATGRLRPPEANLDLAARLGAMRDLAEVAAVLLTSVDELRFSPNPPPERLLVAQALKGRAPIARTISALFPAQADPGTAAAGRLTDSELRVLDRMEWLMTMAAYCQGDTFKPETCLQIRLGEVRPLNEALLKIVYAHERSHPDTTGGGKDAASPMSAKDPTAGAGQPYLNSFD